MTLDKARELLTVRINVGGGHNRAATRPMLGEVEREHGADAARALVRALDLERIFGVRPGTYLTK